jgi:hypothetical protein
VQRPVRLRNNSRSGRAQDVSIALAGLKSGLQLTRRCMSGYFLIAAYAAEHFFVTFIFQRPFSDVGKRAACAPIIF